MNAVMTLREADSFSAIVRAFFPHQCQKGCRCRARAFSGCHAGHDMHKPVTAKPKTKNTPAHQGKFPLTPLSSSASTCAAHPVKGRCALRSVSLHIAPDLLARLRPSLLTTAAPREISPQRRRLQKTANTIPAFLISASAFSGSSYGRASGGSFCLQGQHRALSGGAHNVFRLHGTCFPPVRRVFSGCGAFAFRKHFSRFLHACSFVRHHPGGPAYVSYRRFASYFTAGEWLRPFEPRRKSQRQEKA